MLTIAQLNGKIDNSVNKNGRNAITGSILNSVLKDIVNNCFNGASSGNTNVANADLIFDDNHSVDQAGYAHTWNNAKQIKRNADLAGPGAGNFVFDDFGNFSNPSFGLYRLRSSAGDIVKIFADRKQRYDGFIGVNMDPFSPNSFSSSASANNSAAIYGVNTGMDSNGVIGLATNETSRGVTGISIGNTGIGVRGQGLYGGYFDSTVIAGTGLYAESSHALGIAFQAINTQPNGMAMITSGMIRSSVGTGRIEITKSVSGNIPTIYGRTDGALLSGQNYNFQFNNDELWVNGKTALELKANGASQFRIVENKIVTNASMRAMFGSSSDPTSTLQTAGSWATPLTSVTTNYTIASTDHTIIDSSVNGITVTLPNATTCTGREYRIMNRSTGLIPATTIATTAGQTVQGNTGALGVNQWRTYKSTGTGWLAI